MFYMKAIIRAWLLKILQFSLVESVTSPALCLHEGKFELQAITFLVDENFTWNPTRQVGIMFARIIGEFCGITLEGKLDGHESN